uniref:Uncharacterized protein n=1 Tax=Aegilops tauschii subsp. strangulata TaxID=200361 RepID=A0A452XVY0_AEGTS
MCRRMVRARPSRPKACPLPLPRNASAAASLDAGLQSNHPSPNPAERLLCLTSRLAR